MDQLYDPSFWTVTFLYPCAYSILVVVAVKVHTHPPVYHPTPARTSSISHPIYNTHCSHTLCTFSIIIAAILAFQLFALLAMRLNNFENHQTQTIFMNRLILKVSAPPPPPITYPLLLIFSPPP